MSVFDCGDAIYVCEYCNGVFWKDESIGYISSNSNHKYSQCCKLGEIRLPYPIRPPEDLLALYRNPEFMDNIRLFNNLFGMTSLGAIIDDHVNKGQGPYVFKISGQIYHWIGSMYPTEADPPRFLQLYIYDTDNEISNRCNIFEKELGNKKFTDIVSNLSKILNLNNEYVRTFKTAHEIAKENHMENYSVRLYNNVPIRTYGAPASGTLGAIVCGEDDNASTYDVIVHLRHGHPQRISKLHPTYMPLQYPLLFPMGEEGWSPKLHMFRHGHRSKKSVTVNMYYSYQIHDRIGTYSLLLHGGRLYQQYLVDAYLCIEQNRLDYIRRNQNILRCEYVAGIYDALGRGDTDCVNIGKRIILPASFTGGPRFMYRHYQDALAICRIHGNPEYFISFTCNVKWPEIKRYIATFGYNHVEDRPDIIARIFRIKVQEFIRFIKEKNTFGQVTAHLYTIEFQKRGLPHCHTLVWIASKDKIKDPISIDRYISAEIPDPIREPFLYNIITECMLHGPCGYLNPNAKCMRNGICSKKFPKPFEQNTRFDKQGYAHYMRRDERYHTMENGINIHNGYVVPYNKQLCSRFNAHINVEYCGWNMLIKYLFKYISKGVERAKFVIHKPDDDDPSKTLEKKKYLYR